MESCRVMIIRSRALTRSMNSSEISLDPFLELMSRTISPRDLSWSVTACLDSASTSPRDGTPARSIALKTNVSMSGYAAWTAWAGAAPAASSKRRSSSGVVDRASASARVILPWRTSVASEESMVCIPAEALVCSTE